MVNHVPLVSVIYPIYNDKPIYIHESLNSILNQSFENLEILIIDDSTNQESIQAVRHFTFDNRVKILKNDGVGLPYALNTAIRQAKGQFLARADSDDILFPNRIQEQVEYLLTHSEVGILGSNVNYVDSEGRLIKIRKYPERDSDIKNKMHIRNPICHSAVMIRKSVFETLSTYDITYKRAEDFELWMRASKNNIIFHNLQNVLMSYRMASGFKRDRANWLINLKIKTKYFSFKHLIPSLIGITTVVLYLGIPQSVKNYIYKKLA